MFDLFPQQNFCDLLKSTAFLHGARRGGKVSTLAAIKSLENAHTWQSVVFAQAIDQVRPGAIWIDNHDTVHIEGGATTLVAIVDTYLELTGEPAREVI